MAFARIGSAYKIEHVSFKSVQRSIIILLCMVAMSASLPIDAAGLTKLQADQARSVSVATQWPRARASAAPHPLGLQTLSIEKQERKNEHNVRWASVYQYHYSLQSARLLIIDLDSNTVAKQSSINSVHLPLNEIEIDFAKSLLSDDKELLDQLRLEQIQRGNVEFGLLNELDVKASIYEPANTAHECYKQRCALISLFDKTHTVFTIEPVVNLTTLQVDSLGSQY